MVLSVSFLCYLSYVPCRPSIKIPVFVIMPIAHLVEWIYRLLGPYGMKVPQLTPSRIRLTSCTRSFDCSKAKDRLGYAPIIPLQVLWRFRKVSVLYLNSNIHGSELCQWQSLIGAEVGHGPPPVFYFIFLKWPTQPLPLPLLHVQKTKLLSPSSM